MEEIKSNILNVVKKIEQVYQPETKDNEVQKHVSCYIEQRLDTMRNMKYEVQEMMIDKSVEDEVLDEWVSSKDIEAIRAVCY